MAKSKPAPDSKSIAAARAEIKRQLNEHNAAAAAISKELAAIFSARKAGNVPVSGPLPEDVKLARARANQMLGGTARFSLPAATDRERELEIEAEAHRLCIKALQAEDVELESAACLQWVRENGDAWSKLCHDWILAAARLRALEEAAYEIVAIKAFGTALPLSEYIGRGTEILIPGESSEHGVNRVAQQAMRERIISKSEFDEAINVKI